MASNDRNLCVVEAPPLAFPILVLIMADSKKNESTPEAPAEPTSAANPTSAPDAGGEPAKQVASTMGRPANPVLPPAPGDYEMPDEYAVDWLGQTRRWVEANPALAVLAAAGIGLVAGRIVMGLFPDPEPDTFARRVERRAKQLSKEASHYADDAGDVLSEQLKKAASALSDAADVVTDKAESGYEKSKDLADVVGDAVKAAITGVVAKKADTLIDRFRK